MSKSSYDAAKELSYYDKVSNGSITFYEYNQLLQADYQNMGNEQITFGSGIHTGFGKEGHHILFAAYQPPVSIATTIGGTLIWIDDNGIEHPLQYTKVVIHDGLYDEVLGTVYTDENGNYGYAFVDTYSYREIYIKIYAAGENARILTANLGEYVYTSSTAPCIAAGMYVDIDWSIDMTSDLGRAFQISQAAIIATRYVKQMNGYYIDPVTIVYPHNEDTESCFYRHSESTIYMVGRAGANGYPNSYASWDVVMHEYGHHIQRKFGITNSPGGCIRYKQISQISIIRIVELD